IIWSFGPTEGLPLFPTRPWSALPTTTPHTTPAGRSASPKTASRNGSRHDTSTPTSGPAATTDIDHHPPRKPNNRTTIPGHAGASHPQREAAPACPFGIPAQPREHLSGWATIGPGTRDSGPGTPRPTLGRPSPPSGWIDW